MDKNVFEKIVESHLVSGSMETGKPVALHIDQTLTQDATGTMACLQFIAMGIDRVKTDLSVSYVDHNTLQNDYMNADDHKFLQTAAARYGIVFSKPGNGICHQLHLENFAKPGATLLGSDSHTPTGGGMGMIAIGSGGLNVAAAMAGEPFWCLMPSILGVRFSGRLTGMVSAKDVILELLRRLSVKGGVNKTVEYYGPGVETLDVPERATICNMGAELGATTSLFPSDNRTKEFLTLQKRLKDFREILPDPGCAYDTVEEIDLSSLQPLIACPHSPDNVKTAKELSHIKVDQVIVGSCTNSSVKDLLTVAAMFKGRTVHPDVDFVIAPGSRQVFDYIASNGALSILIQAGARIIESACGPCIGMGQAPRSGGVSVRSFNRNFKGRSGTQDADVYLASPAVCAAAALTGRITDPHEICKNVTLHLPETINTDKKLFIIPTGKDTRQDVIMGPNIKPCPLNTPPDGDINGTVLIKTGDNITTDHIMPAGSKVLPLRSNIPEIAKYVFHSLDPGFYERARHSGGGFIIGGANYGQGSSREHAALAPMYLGVKAVFAVSFARIHRENLINFGIIPLRFKQIKDYESIEQGHNLLIKNLEKALKNADTLEVFNTTQQRSFEALLELSAREREILLKGGYLSYIKARQ